MTVNLFNIIKWLVNMQDVIDDLPSSRGESQASNSVNIHLTVEMTRRNHRGFYEAYF